MASRDPERAERVIKAHLDQVSNAYWRAMAENGGETRK
jgi:DNA-binding GntR family transcriptional regulator